MVDFLYLYFFTPYFANYWHLLWDVLRHLFSLVNILRNLYLNQLFDFNGNFFDVLNRLNIIVVNMLFDYLLYNFLHLHNFFDDPGHRDDFFHKLLNFHNPGHFNNFLYDFFHNERCGNDIISDSLNFYYFFLHYLFGILLL